MSESIRPVLWIMATWCVATPTGIAVPAFAQIAATRDELADTRQWAAARFQRTQPTAHGKFFTSDPPFSFVYDGKLAHELIKGWELKRNSKKLDDSRTEHSLVYTDPKTGLQVRCVAIEYHDFPTVEWTLYLKNMGSADTPIIEQVQALDVELERGTSGEFLLHHHVGSPATGSDYGPLETPLGLGASKRIAAAGGRPTNSDWSYFNLEWGGAGLIVAVGWPGQWAAEFVRTGDRALRIRAGQELTHFKLRPGEEVRSPLIVLQFWNGGDWIRSQNIWRRWMMGHSMPRPGGKLPPPQLLASSSRQYDEMIKANEENQVMFINRYLEERIKLDYWWMDAGWYLNKTGWPNVGTWEVDTKRFPRGLRAVSDHAHKHGLKTLVWFEPERVTPGTWLHDNHPEWLLAGPGDTNPLAGLGSRRSSQLGGTDPCVTHNPTDRTLTTAGIRWEPGRLAFHPGSKGEYSVVRWTAPEAGSYAASATFLAIDKKATTDVHVLHNSQSLYHGTINLDGHGDRSSFEQKLGVAKGDTIDFVVGFGNGTHVCDSTGLVATLRGEAGRVHDAAKEFQIDRNPNGPWSYGHLRPGPAPDPATFRPYDVHEVARDGGTRLLNLGNRDARHWLTEHIDRLINDQGIDLYRQDFNMDPLAFWRGSDVPDRQGITENHYVTGFLAFWDEVLRRHPNMLIDSCASGGRRNDLETMRRAVPLWRSDHAFITTSHQCMTWGISLWLPFHGTGTVAVRDASYYGSGLTPVEPYAFWSNAAPSFVFGIDMRENELDYATLRRLVDEWREISPNYYGDFYPLTPWSRDNTAWMAWQFDRPEAGAGIVQVFRRENSPDESACFPLRGLDTDAKYFVRKLDDNDAREISGRELMKTGVPSTINDTPGVIVFTYKRIGAE